jgi:hypothetical protein
MDSDRPTLCGMTRARISTTVDAEKLADARARFGGRDADLFDQALELWLQTELIERERRAILARPYDDDPDLRVQSSEHTVADLEYVGDPPESVLRRAKLSRHSR